MINSWLLEGIVAPDRPDLELSDAIVLQHCPHLSLDFCCQFLHVDTLAVLRSSWKFAPCGSNRLAPHKQVGTDGLIIYIVL